MNSLITINNSIIRKLLIFTSYRLTVRTLDFHSNNVGSIPASLILHSQFLHHNYIYKKQLNWHRNGVTSTSKKNTYVLAFTSLISPTAVTKTRILFMKIRNQKQKKLLLKQSYLLLTWFAYLARSSYQTHNSTKLSKPVLSFKPTKKTIFTLTKAPMAHKTFSQEQFVFKFYQVSVRFSLQAYTDLTVNQSIYLLLLLRKSIPITETNLLFLKRFTLTLTGSDTMFFRKLIY